ncbi:hypothetical protein [Falsiroseomonas sp. HW251]|uniref:hypothetical protein n=1 Tax=Falsiroseomonas sp. HW251 TaxID=3390998 RepID=UPI003D323C92
MDRGENCRQAASSDAHRRALAPTLAEVEQAVGDGDAEAALQACLGALSQSGRAALLATLRRMEADPGGPARRRSDLAAFAEEVEALAVGSVDS